MTYLNKTELICDTVDNGIVLLGQNLEVLFWNKWLETRTHIPSKEILKKNITEVFPQINKEKLKRKIKAALTLNSPTFYTTEVNNAFFNIELSNKITNKVFDYMQQDVTITPYDIEKQMVVVYIYDTTILSQTNFQLKKAKNILEKEHKKTLHIKQKLEESNEEFELLLNATMEAIVLFDVDYNCININNMGVELFSFAQKEEALTKKIDAFFHDNTFKYQHLNTTCETVMRTQNNTTFPALIKIKDAVLKNKKFKILTVIDLTELKYRDKLIAEQSKMVAMGEMIGNIAHQWRQPLSTISTAASGVKLQKELGVLSDELLDECLDGIVRNSMHLSQTINDFRDFIQGDKEIVPFNLKENIKKDLSIVEGMLKHSEIKVVMNCEDDIVLHNYQNELTQAVLNIIDNCKDALFENNIQEKMIFIECYQQNTHAILKIYDNAKGIDTNILEKIFEPYFTTKHKSQGTGLGLYMTHQIIEGSMQGVINASNIAYNYNEQSFKGALFTITLPLQTKGQTQT
jgi:signal transduction histidine kinase